MPVQVRCTILDAWGWCTGTTQRDGVGREEGSGWGTRVCLWRVHFDIWQNQYNIVKFKNKIKKKKRKNQINNLTLHLKQLEKEEQKNPKVTRRKEIIKTRAEITEKNEGDYTKNQQN